MFTSFTYQKLENVNRHLIGFMFTPMILTFVLMNKIVEKKEINHFEKQFFKILLKKSMLKFSIVLSIIMSLLLMVEPNLFILTMIILTSNIAISSFIMYTLKENFNGLKAIENISQYKEQLIFE